MYRASVLLFLIPAILMAQEPEFRKRSWEEDVEYPVFSEKELQEQFIILKDHRTTEYIYDSEENLREYESIHKMIFVNSDGAVDSYNKYYISFGNARELVEFRARTVKPGGDPIEIDESHLKVVEDYDEAGAYKIFTFEGVEKGDIVEVMYTLEQNVSLYGRYIYSATGVMRDAQMEIISPVNLVFAAREYNHIFKAVDTIITEKNYLIRSSDSIPALPEEKYAILSANKARIEYIFHDNTLNSSTSYHSWANAARSYYTAFYENDKKTGKKLTSLLNKLKIKALDDDDKISSVERYIKDNYEVKSIEGIPGGDEIMNIIANKYSSEIGITKLYLALFDAAGIEVQLGVTSDRNELRFDRSFMTWNYLNDFVIYFPSTNKYLDPVSFEYRYGTLPAYLSNTDGLFLKRVSIGDITTAVPVFRFIPSPAYKDNFSNKDIEVSFPKSMEHALVDLRDYHGGESGIPLKPYFEYLPREDRDALLEQLVKAIGEDVEILEVDVINTSFEDSPVEKPLTVIAKVEYVSALEQAGDDYIFNIGKLIGEQAEMYQDHSRQQPIDIGFKHVLDRKISFILPGGYNVKGLEALKINIEYSTEGENSMGFISDYSIEGNRVEVLVHEYYARIEYPMEQYDEFRRVINAAADFNKISLLFEKK